MPTNLFILYLDELCTKYNSMETNKASSISWTYGVFRLFEVSRYICIKSDKIGIPFKPMLMPIISPLRIYRCLN